ncbi:hypothetical protein M8J77_001386 [Diaphorina citri]|jgi:Leucine-rich repeat (LRR) protein|nr:hypothetical protein M8J77_001386 [Diaphorina citri]
MSLCCCYSGDEFNVFFRKELFEKQEEEEEEQEEKKKQEKTNPDIFPIYLFDDIKRNLNDFESKGVLTQKIIGTGLSHLKNNHKSGGWNLTKLVLIDKNLFDVEILNEYSNLTWIDLSGNRIVDMVDLQNNTGLEHLTLARNDIHTLVMSPWGFFYLQVLNLSYNRISYIPSNFSEQFHLLTHLDLSHNFITEINGLSFNHLKCLQTLDLSFNKIRKLEKLANLNMSELYVQNNEIHEYDLGDAGLSSNKNLIIMDISYNSLRTLELFSAAYSLLEINASNNIIDNPVEVLHLGYLSKLRELNLENNPLTSWCLYKSYVLSIAKNLFILDGNILCGFDFDNKLNADKPFWDQFAQNIGRNIITQKVSNALNDIPMIPQNRRNIFIILVGTLGCYMDDICIQIARMYPHIHALKKITTNTARSKNTINITNEHFNELVRRGEFITVVERYNIRYGYSQRDIHKCFQECKICLTDMDLKGALSVWALGYQPYLILVTVYNRDIHRAHLLENFKISIFQSTHAGVIREKEKVEETIEWSEFDVHRTSTTCPKMKSSLIVTYSAMSNIEWESFENQNNDDASYSQNNMTEIGKSQNIKTDISECETEDLDSEEYLEEELQDEEHDAMGKNIQDECKRVGPKKITKKKEISINKTLLNDAREMFFKEIFQTSDLYEEIYNEKRELFYSSMKLRDISDGTRKLKSLLNAIVGTHGEMKIKYPLDEPLRRDPLYGTYIENILDKF